MTPGWTIRKYYIRYITNNSVFHVFNSESPSFLPVLVVVAIQMALSSYLLYIGL